MSFQEKFHKNIKKVVFYLEGFISRPWYSLLMLALAMADIFVFVIPTDGIMLSSAMIQPKKWKSYALATALGSSLGGFLLLDLIRYNGMDFLNWIYPDVMQTSAWTWTLHFFEDYGLMVVFLVGVSPFMPLPILTFVAFTSYLPIPVIGIYFIGRIIKNFGLCYLASHAPRVLSRIWGIQSELKEVQPVIETRAINNSNN